MFYIHNTVCISPQQTFADIDIDNLNKPSGNKLNAREPSYKDIPSGILRRMGKAVRMSAGAAIPLLQGADAPDGFIIGTANGGMEDCIKFLNQIIGYEEGILTPGNFVQSTPAAIASQISLLTANKSYNITHVHRGLAFENAVFDAAMQIKEKPGSSFLIGGVDEISSYNFNIDNLDGWYKQELSNNNDLYSSGSPGTIAGEGAAMFLVNGTKDSSIARLKGLSTMHTKNEEEVTAGLQAFIYKYLIPGEEIDLFLSGENGDSRLSTCYNACETLVGSGVSVGRFKHMSGEYATASAFALWLGCRILKEQYLPPHIQKNLSEKKKFQNILIYNNYKGYQHSFMLLSR